MGDSIKSAVARRLAAHHAAASTNKQTIILPWTRGNWNNIKQKLSEPIASTIDLAYRMSALYLGRIKAQNVTDMLNTYYNDENYAKFRISQDELIKQIVPFIIQLILSGPKHFKGVVLPVLPDLNTVSAPAASVALSRRQVAVLNACMFFGLFEFNYVTRGTHKLEVFSDYSVINVFINQSIFAWQCLINYFRRIAMASDAELDATIIIQRKRLVQRPDWTESTAPICNIIIGEGDNGTAGHIDDSPSMMHVCYSDEYIGNGSFSNVLTQEEVMFLIRPECLVSMLFCMKLAPNEAVCIYGAEKMNQYSGYASNVRYMGDFVDDFPRGGSENMLRHILICIDASTRVGSTAQCIDEFDRDLNKAYCGFAMAPISGGEIATGNWGSGAFGGNIQVKFIQQLLAASLAGRTLVYYPFARDFEDQLLPFIDWLQANDLNVGIVYCLYKEMIKMVYRGPNTRLGDLNIFENLMDM